MLRMQVSLDTGVLTTLCSGGDRSRSTAGGSKRGVFGTAGGRARIRRPTTGDKPLLQPAFWSRRKLTSARCDGSPSELAGGDGDLTPGASATTEESEIAGAGRPGEPPSEARSGGAPTPTR